jgi:hypothetical protein
VVCVANTGVRQTLFVFCAMNVVVQDIVNWGKCCQMSDYICWTPMLVKLSV